MHQPSGFRTNYRSTDFDGEEDESPGASAPTVSVSGPPDEQEQVLGALVSTYEQAPLVQFNDNNGQALSRGPRARRLPGQRRVAVRAHERVATEEPDHRARDRHRRGPHHRPHDGVVWTRLTFRVGLFRTRPCTTPQESRRTGRLAEVLRRSAKRLLDIDPQELVFGLHPRSDGSMSVFMADALDNGAGYAAEIARADNFGSLLTGAASAPERGVERQAPLGVLLLLPRLPEVLRQPPPSRLLGLASGPGHARPPGRRAIDARRWFDLGAQAAAGIARTELMSLEAGQTSEGVPFVRDAYSRKVVLLGHPLWWRTHERQSPTQADALAELAAGSGHVEQSDVFEALRRPLVVLRKLM